MLSAMQPSGYDRQIRLDYKLSFAKYFISFHQQMRFLKKEKEAFASKVIYDC